MFNRFKEKLSGYKEALSAKIAEKVSASGANKEPRPEEIEAEGRLALEAEGSSRKDSRSKGSGEGPRKSPQRRAKERPKRLHLFPLPWRSPRRRPRTMKRLIIRRADSHSCRRPRHWSSSRR